MENNMRFYEAARTVPEEAKKQIKAGRLKGFTDVNPMYRIKRLTEIFGPCGVGWWYVPTGRQIIDDPTTGQRIVIQDINLFYIDPYTGKTSQPIPGTGGASLLAKETNGFYLSDECCKMALTDAISVAAKAIGIAADVYWERDRTKYTVPAPDPQPTSRGTHETAQAVGQAKLERVNAKIAQAMQSTAEPITGPQPATEAQKQLIRDTASDEDYLNIIQRYGPELERLSMSGAVKVIREIEKRNAEAS